MDDHEHSEHESPPRSLREVLGKPALITGLAFLGVWLVAAGYTAVVIASAVADDNPAAVAFAVVELGIALVALGALGLFATLSVFLATHAVRAVRPRRQLQSEEATAEPPGNAELAE